MGGPFYTKPFNLTEYVIGSVQRCPSPSCVNALADVCNMFYEGAEKSKSKAEKSLILFLLFSIIKRTEKIVGKTEKENSLS